MTNLDSMFKKQRHHFADKGPYNQSYGFSSSHVWMWDLDNKKGWVPKKSMPSNYGVGEDIENLTDCKEVKPVNLKGNQSWIFIRRTDSEAEAPILWPPDAKNWLTRKGPDAGKNWKQKKRVTEDEMVRWHHWLDGHESEQTAGHSEGQGILVCCSPRGHNLATEQQQHVASRAPLTFFQNIWLYLNYSMRKACLL